MGLSKMPPAVMLLIVIGLAVVVTMMVTGRVSEQEEALLKKKASLEQTAPQTDLANSTNIGHSNKLAFYSLSYIPAGMKIEAKQIGQRRIGELELWDDAVLITDDVVGHVPKHPIPVNTQIRRSYLD
jgi:flagella basal body P-ring formation protein FlgA